MLEHEPMGESNTDQTPEISGIQPVAVPASPEVVTPDTLSQTVAASPNAQAIQREERFLEAEETVNPQPALTPVLAGAGGPNVEAHILRTTTPAPRPRTFPTPRGGVGTGTGSAEDTGGHGIRDRVKAGLRRVGGFLSRHKTAVKVAGAGVVIGTAAVGVDIALNSNNGEHQPNPTIPAIGIGERSPKPSDPIVIQTATPFTPAPSPSVEPSTTATIAPSPTSSTEASASTQPSVPPPSESLSPQELIQRNITNWMAPESDPNRTQITKTWIDSNGNSVNYGLDSNLKSDTFHYHVYLGIMLGAIKLDNGEVIAVFGMQDSANPSNRFYTVFRAGTNDPSDYFQVDTTRTRNALLQTYSPRPMSESGFESLANTTYIGMPAMIQNSYAYKDAHGNYTTDYNSGTSHEKAVLDSRTATDAVYSFGSSAETGDVSKADAPWPINVSISDINSSNVGQLPEFSSVLFSTP